MSPGKRGDKDADSGGAPSPSRRDGQPGRVGGGALQKGPSTDTLPPDQQPKRRRQRLATARKAAERPATAPAASTGSSNRREQPKNRRETASAPSGSGSVRPQAAAPEPEAEDAWAEYEEDASDWVLTDEQPNVVSPSAKVGSNTAEQQLQAAAAAPTNAPEVFDPAQYAVPQGPVAEAAMARWRGLSGQDTGRSWSVPAAAMSAGRIRLGRGVDNDVVLGDPSISRLHAELNCRAGAWEIVDLQSGNGTFVAGQRTSRAPFVPGDTLGLGHGTYRLEVPSPLAQAALSGGLSVSSGFAATPLQSASGVPVAPAGPPTSLTTKAPTSREGLWTLPARARRAPRWLQVLCVAAAGCASLTAAAAGWHMLRVWDIVGPLHTAIFEHYIEGVEALTSHRWDDAEQSFRAVLEADPNSVRGQAYLRAAGVGRSDAQELELAQRAFKAGNLPQAYAATTELQDGFFHAEARSLRQSVGEHVTSQLDRAHQALEAGHLQEAQDLLAEVENTIPHRPDVALMRSRAEASLGTLASGAPSRVPQSAARARLSPRRRMKPLSGPLADAIKDFNAANPEAALAKLEGVAGAEARQLTLAVRAFMRSYQTGLAEHRGKRAFNAIQALTQAKTQEARIGGGGGQLAGMIDAKLADMYYVIGMQAYARGSWGEAGEAWRQAIERVPNHALSRRKLEELDAKAKALMDEANGIKAQNTEKARSLLRQVAQMVPPGSDVGIRARRLNATLR